MKKNLLILLFASTIFEAKAQNKYELKDVTLTAIDTALMDNYSLLTFKDVTMRYQVLVSRNPQANIGCWEYVVLNKKYRINLKSISGYTTDKGVLIPTQGRGFIITNDIIHPAKNKKILETNEFFYTSDDINGLLIRQK